MKSSKVSFTISGHAAWAPGIETLDAWLAWANEPFLPQSGSEPGVRAMPPMLRRRASFLGKMALESAYQCLGEHKNIPTIFCSRHGEVYRSFEMLSDLAKSQPLSPASFGLSVHNAIGGLFSIARADKSNHVSLAAGDCSVEAAVVEACGLLADGEQRVLLVVYECPLPPAYDSYLDAKEHPFSWAWLMEPAGDNGVTLEWTGATGAHTAEPVRFPPGLEIFRSYLLSEDALSRSGGRQQWRWSWNA